LANVVIAKKVGGETGLNERRPDGVDANPTGRPVKGKRADKIDDTGLGGAIGR
jgi:hypothetical protein